MRNQFEEKVRNALSDNFKYEGKKMPYTLECVYIPDFVDEEHRHIIEAKGYFSPEDRRKMKAVKDQYPDWTVILLFQNPNQTLNRKSKTTYAKWAEKNGFQWRGL